MWWINESCLISLCSYGVAIVAMATLAGAALFRQPTLRGSYQQALRHTAKLAKVDETSLWLQWPQILKSKTLIPTLGKKTQRRRTTQS